MMRILIDPFWPIKKRKGQLGGSQYIKNQQRGAQAIDIPQEEQRNMGGTEESSKKEEKHKDGEEEETKDKKDKKCNDEEKAEKKKKKENPEDKKDPHKLKLKLEKLDAKMQALVTKREEILKLLNEAEQIAKDSIPAQPLADTSA